MSAHGPLTRGKASRLIFFQDQAVIEKNTLFLPFEGHVRERERLGRTVDDSHHLHQPPISTDGNMSLMNSTTDAGASGTFPLARQSQVSVIAVSVVFIILPTVAVFLRLVARRMAHRGMDASDYCIIGACVSCQCRNSLLSTSRA